MPNQDFRAELQQVKVALRQARAPASLERRLDRRTRKNWMGWVALAAVPAALALLWWLRPAAPSSLDKSPVVAVQQAPPRAPEKPRVGAFWVEGDAPAKVLGDRLWLSAGPFVLRSVGREVSLEVLEPSSIAAAQSGLRMLSGRVRWKVRPTEEPLWLHVSHGKLRMLGGHFSVTQRELGGEAKALSGELRFRGAKEASWRKVGAVVRWPVAPAKTQHRASKEAPKVVWDVEATLKKVAAFRSQGRYSAAITELEEALRVSPAQDRPVLSFELGAILSYHTADQARACEYWERYKEQFVGGGGYLDEVRTAQHHLGCMKRGDSNE